MTFKAANPNPIIGDSCADTLYQAACVAAFLARYQLDRADGLFQGEMGGAFRPDPLNANETRGLSLLTESLAAALWFELEGRQKAEREQP